MHQPRTGSDSIERRYLQFLVEVGAILGESMDFTSTLQRVCDAAVGTVADAATMYLAEDGRLELVAAAHFDPALTPVVREGAKRLTSEKVGPRAWLERVVTTGEPLLVESVDDPRAIAASPEHAAYLQEMGIASIVIVPLVSPSRGIVGALGLTCVASSGMSYDRESLVIAQDLGRRCGMAIAKARLHALAVDVSERFQRAALPRALPSVRGLSLDAFYEPASSDVLVGGDWYDAFNLPDGRLGLSVGDVSGHGVAAAALMGSIRDALRVALYIDPDMLGALRVADLLLREEAHEGMFATANLAIVDVQHSTISCIAAGHPGPILWAPQSGTVEDIFADRGLPLGLRGLGASSLAAQTVELRPGAMLAFFTDGLLEWDRDYLGGEQLLIEALARPEIRESAHPARAIREAVAPPRHSDDLAVMTLRVDVPV